MSTALIEDNTLHASLPFRAMGTECEVQVWAPHGANDLAELARLRVDLLDKAWSRFRADSELSHVNRAAGRGSIQVSEDFALLVRTMREGWEISGGAFDPTITPSLKHWGYDSTFTEVLGRTGFASTQSAPGAAPGMGGVLLNGTTLTVPAGVELDSGSVGKGLAADIISAELTAAGATGVLINLGGDVVVRGVPGAMSEWVIDIADERDAGTNAGTFAFPANPDTHMGIATSTTLKRTWAHGLHHIIDPRTGSVATTTAAQVSVLSTSGALAEIIATTALLATEPESTFRKFEAQGIALPYPTYHVAGNTEIVGGEDR